MVSKINDRISKDFADYGVMLIQQINVAAHLTAEATKGVFSELRLLLVAFSSMNQTETYAIKSAVLTLREHNKQQAVDAKAAIIKLEAIARQQLAQKSK